TDEVGGRDDLDVHDRLEQLDAGLFATLLHGCAGRDLEGDGRRVDLVEGSVEQGHLGVDERESDQHAGVPYAAYTLFDAGAVFLGPRAADDPARELIALADLVRLEPELDARELSGAAGLLLVRVIDLARAHERLAVGDLRRPDIGIDTVRTLQDVDLDVEMQL